MGKLAQQLGGQSQVKVFKKGGLIESKEPKAEERRESKLKPQARAKVEAKEARVMCGGGMVKKGKK